MFIRFCFGRWGNKNSALGPQYSDSAETGVGVNQDFPWLIRPSLNSTRGMAATSALNQRQWRCWSAWLITVGAPPAGKN